VTLPPAPGSKGEAAPPTRQGNGRHHHGAGGRPGAGGTGAHTWDGKPPASATGTP
jgi:hypothetical protein